VGAVVVVVLVALLDSGLIHWRTGGQLRKLHRVQLLLMWGKW
jgi:hypothetical protein